MLAREYISYKLHAIRVRVHACREILCPKSWWLLETVLRHPRAISLNGLYLVHVSNEGYGSLTKAEYKSVNGICICIYIYARKIGEVQWRSQGGD